MAVTAVRCVCVCVYVCVCARACVLACAYVIPCVLDRFSDVMQCVLFGLEIILLIEKAY